MRVPVMLTWRTMNSTGPKHGADEIVGTVLSIDRNQVGSKQTANSICGTSSRLTLSTDDAGLRHLTLGELRKVRMEGDGGEGRHLPGVEHRTVLDAELHILVDTSHASDRNRIASLVDKPGVLQLQA